MLNKTKFNDLKKIVERYESPQAKKERLLSEQEILLQAQNPQVLKNEFQVNPFLNKPTQQMVPTPTQLRHMNNLAPNLPTKPGAVSVQPIPNQQFLDVTSSPHQLVPASPTPRGWMDKMMDTIIGDDQFNKYALICQSCFTHNGLCLPEEFQNTKFKCYKCNFLNIRGDGNFPVKSMTNSPSINSIVDTDTESHIQDSLQTSLLDSINDNDNQVLSEPQQKVDQVSTPNILIQNATVVEEITVTQISKEILVEINQLEQVDEGKENSTLESTNSSIPHHRHHQESDEDLVMVSNEVEEK
ncbi:hypothetical protein HK099_003685 [Clydaea vesicula]|uniref:Endoplasmic reticulum junction formation protein lunapark n=1 Tax=Clydaea vesicula TaxID=447962 RepID=A0AAD5U1H8_9FUNG|nr:hypothetical protein HK099_003685 [Clydaea vesicula]